MAGNGRLYPEILSLAPVFSFARRFALHPARYLFPRSAKAPPVEFYRFLSLPDPCLLSAPGYPDLRRPFKIAAIELEGWPLECSEAPGGLDLINQLIQRIEIRGSVSRGPRINGLCAVLDFAALYPGYALPMSAGPARTAVRCPPAEGQQSGQSSCGNGHRAGHGHRRRRRPRPRQRIGVVRSHLAGRLNDDRAHGRA